MSGLLSTRKELETAHWSSSRLFDVDAASGLSDPRKARLSGHEKTKSVRFALPSRITKGTSVH